MNYMKKSIISITIIMFFLLVGCKKQNKIWVYEYDYSLINQNFIIDIYTNLKDNPYLKEENILSIFIYNSENEDLLPIKIVSITKDKINKKNYKHRLELDLNLHYNDLLKIKKAYLIINYINDKTVKINIGSLSVIRVEESYDMSVGSLVGNIKDYKLDSIKIRLTNDQKKEIRLLDVLVINAKIDNIHLDENFKDIKEIEIYNDEIIRNAGIVIRYQLNEENRYKAIYNFNFVDNYKLKENIYYV